MSPRKPTRIGPIAAVALLVLLVGAAAVYLLFGNRWQARHDVRELYRGLNFYLAEQGVYPEGSLADIAALLRGSTVRGQNPDRKSYIVARPDEMNSAGEFIDPWHSAYRIRITPAPRVWSCGPNRQDEGGGGDDISWPKQPLPVEPGTGGG